jgi:uncharacterized protein YpmB
MRVMNLLKNYQFITIIILVIIVLASWFYWSQFRPYKIYRDCSKLATEKALDYSLMEGDKEDKELAKKGRYYQGDYDVYYNRCLRVNGINAPDTID